MLCSLFYETSNENTTFLYVKFILIYEDKYN